MAACRYKTSLRVLKNNVMSERSERMKHFFDTRREISYLQAAM